jgi:hypothetical protein
MAVDLDEKLPGLEAELIEQEHRPSQAIATFLRA